MKEERPPDSPGPSSGSARRPEVLYRTIEDIAGMDLSALADGGFVFLWCPQHHLPTAFRVLERWGLEYRWTMVWEKTAGIRMPGGVNSTRSSWSWAPGGTPSSSTTAR